MAAPRAPYMMAPPGSPIRVLPSENTTSSTRRLPIGTREGVTSELLQFRERLRHGRHRSAIQGVAPDPSLLQRRSNEKPVGVGKPGEILDRDARPHEHRETDGSRGVTHFIGRGLLDRK